MADLQCGKFELLKQVPAPGMLTFHARLNGAPSALWRMIFEEYQAMECTLSNHAVARVRSDVIEFSVPEACAHAAAAAIRRCIDKTNAEVAQRALRNRAVVASGGDMSVDDWRRIEDRYRDGL
jgi:hypothetical protein